MAQKKEKRYVTDNAQLMAERNWKRNIKLKSTPKELTLDSNKRVWWKCNKGYEWLASVSNRNFHKSGCPYCSSKKAFAGFNDLATVNPTPATEWHPTLNGFLTPGIVVAGNNKSVWWHFKRDAKKGTEFHYAVMYTAVDEIDNFGTPVK